MNQNALWKYLLLAVVVIVGALYALPNLYGEDPAVQVSPRRGGLITETTVTNIKDAMKAVKIEYKNLEQTADQVLIRFHDTEAQLEAVDEIQKAVGNDYQVALNLAASTPDWLTSLGAEPMFLGLDLRGGVHFLLEVDMNAAVFQAVERYTEDLRGLLREEKIRYVAVTKEGDSVRVRFRDAESRDRAVEKIADEFRSLNVVPDDAGGSSSLLATLQDSEIRQVRRFALEQNITTLRNRVNELGVAEPLIQQQGDNRVVVQLPGVQDTVRAKEILGATATLEFRLVDVQHDLSDAVNGKVPAGSRLYKDRQGSPVLLQRRVIVTGDQIIDAASGIEQQGGTPAVFITLDGKGARKMSNISRDNIGKPMAVVFIENKSETKWVDGEPTKSKRKVEEVINVATIRDHLSKRFQISGLDSPEEARDLALLLRAGALAAPMDIVEERTVGPSLGRENIEQGFRSVIIGFVAVLVVMAIYYRAFGLVANLALTMNLVLIVALLSMLQATLTLPGIAGIVLTVGMAVDANVLIFERIREELRLGNSPQASIHAGYEKAFSTIADANITTLIAAVVLFSFGTGPIKGFAVTLSLGIVTSMFTAIFGTRVVVNAIFGGKRLKTLSI
ncbi:MAG: protein translocase subunit SecD [Chromatiales bacterium]|nr:protein translocase subunit SecD [Chromatiales bacterium]